jgi:hypothetical protein
MPNVLVTIAKMMLFVSDVPYQSPYTRAIGRRHELATTIVHVMTIPVLWSRGAKGRRGSDPGAEKSFDGSLVDIWDAGMI